MKCGMKWMQIFRWNMESDYFGLGWITNQWKSAYTWKERTATPRSKWVTAVDLRALQPLWDTAASSQEGKVNKQYFACINNAGLTCADVVAKGGDPVLSATCEDTTAGCDPLPGVSVQVKKVVPVGSGEIAADEDLQELNVAAEFKLLASDLMSQNAAKVSQDLVLQGPGSYSDDDRSQDLVLQGPRRYSDDDSFEYVSQGPDSFEDSFEDSDDDSF